MIVRVWAVCLSAALAGCTAELQVQVDVMNPGYLRAATAEMAFVSDANELASGTSVRADRILLETERELVTFGERCLRSILAEQQQALGSSAEPRTADIRRNIGVVTRSLAGLPGRVQAFQTEWRLRLRAADVAARATILRDLPQITGLSGWHPQPTRRRGTTAWPDAMPESVKIGLVERQLVYDEYGTAVSGHILAERDNCLGQAITLPVQQAIKEAAAETEANTAELATNVVGSGMLLSRMTEAFFATSADETVWAHGYNQAVGGGYNGNVSVALVMNDTADFAVKGMVFDGRSTAEMMTKLATQTIATVATAYGAPFTLASRGTDGAQPGLTYQNTQDLSVTETTIAAAQAEEQAWRAGLLAIATAIGDDFDDLAAGNEVAEARAGAVVSAYGGGT